MLNGRAALAAGKNDMSSSEDDDDEGSTKHKFSQPDHAKIMIESKFSDVMPCKGIKEMS